MHRDLRDTPEWPLLLELHHQGAPLDKVSELVGFSQEEIVKTFGGWTGVERTRPKRAKDGTTTCPKCGHEAWPVRYGMWLPDRGKPAPKVVMAGCVIEPDAPQWTCLYVDCGYEWRVDPEAQTGF